MKTLKKHDDKMVILKKTITRRRGIAFAVDALFAIAVIAVFTISIVPARSTIATDAAQDALSMQSAATLRSMCLATASELSADSVEIAELYSDSNLTDADSEMTVCQLVARLSTGDAESIARAHNVTAEIYGALNSPSTKLAVYANGTLIYNTTFEPAFPKALHSSTTFVYTYGKAGIAAEPMGPIKMETRVWWP